MAEILTESDVRELIKNNHIIQNKIILSGFKGFSRAECRYLLNYSIDEFLHRKLEFDSYDEMVVNISNNEFNPLMNFQVELKQKQFDDSMCWTFGKLQYFDDIWIRYQWGFDLSTGKYLLERCCLFDDCIELLLDFDTSVTGYEMKFAYVFNFLKRSVQDSNSKYWLSDLYEL